ncbi:MAG: hypothetical protein U0R79_10815 [Propionicimonas sp.]
MAATDAFQRAADQGGGLVSCADLARCWLTDAAVDTADPAASSARPSSTSSPTPRSRLPWSVYKGVARAGLAMVQGRPEVAVELLDEVITGDPQLPAANVLAAQCTGSAGRRARPSPSPPG